MWDSSSEEDYSDVSTQSDNNMTGNGHLQDLPGLATTQGVMRKEKQEGTLLRILEQRQWKGGRKNTRFESCSSEEESIKRM